MPTASAVFLDLIYTLTNACFNAHVYAFFLNGVNITEGRRELVLEKPPKWEALTEVLEEIEKENQSAAHEPGDHIYNLCPL